MKSAAFGAVAAALAVITGCGRSVKPDQPGPAVSIVEVPVATYVPIDEQLTARCRWRESAPLEEAPMVARERKGCLQFYEANIGAISRIQGKPVPKPAIKRSEK